jgi:lipopolysaccharide/colanic/teichoic acid biosynthesis glycosyltransferase
MIQAPATSKAKILPAATARRINNLLKVGLDYALTIPTLILITPLLLVIAVLIKLDSPGPILYRMRMVGKNGREFDAFKFRTMFIDSGDRLIANRKQWMEVIRAGEIETDPRLTHVGRFLRRYGLDELPRLINVLNRTMSLVGPRMMNRTDLLRFGYRVQGYTSVLPGMTGLWQVNGHNRDLNVRAELESEYIRNYSVLLDLKILFQSVIVAFAQN